MKRIELDISCIESVGALHIYLAYMLDLPAHYGRNLDALYDVLSTESDAAHIVLRGQAKAGSAVEAYLPGLIAVLEESAQENEKIRFERA